MATGKDALIPLLNRYYEEIAAMEQHLQLVADAKNGDFRPRIELAHDAVRAYTSGVDPYLPHSRLSVENLARDVEMLRYLEANPLASLPGGHIMSPKQAVAVRGLQPRPNARPGAAKRAALKDAYQKYAVLFVALLAETADMNFQTRTEEQNLKLDALAEMQHEAKRHGRVDLSKMAVHVIPDAFLAAELQAELPAGMQPAQQAQQMLQQQYQAGKQSLQSLDKAHMSYLSGQLALYQQGKQVVKDLMGQGMNLAGSFLENAMQQQAGRGQGRGM